MTRATLVWMTLAAALPCRAAIGTCSVATLAGAWGFSARGQLSTPGSTTVAAWIDPVAEAGTMTFDGKGGVTVNETLSNNGQVTQAVSFTGTYSVASDCTFTIIAKGGPVTRYKGILVSGGSAFRLTSSDGDTWITGAGEQIASGAGACGSATASGTFGFDLQGYVKSSSTPAAVDVRSRIVAVNQNTPFAASGKLTFDGAGHLTYSETYSIGGQINTVPSGTGAYTVNPDCSFRLSLQAGPSILYTGVFVNAATEFLIIDATGGNTDSGSAAHQ